MTAKPFTDVSLLSGGLIVVFVGTLFISSSLLLLVGVPISRHIVPLGLVVTALCWLAMTRAHPIPRVRLHVALVVFATFTISFALSLTMFDLSWDGQTYHQEAVIQLANGWNPVVEALHPASEFERRLFLWNNHYPKAPEIVQACLFKATNRIESGKAVNLLLMFASFYLALASLCRVKSMPIREAVLFSGLGALNPVSISQSLTFYVDGQLASLFLCLLAGAALFYAKPDRYLAALLTVMSVYFINVKFTAVVYFAIFSMGALLIAFLAGRSGVLRGFSRVFVCALVLGVFMLGYNPYVTNYTQYGHPFHPVLGTESVDVMKDERPGAFSQMNGLQRLALSLFAESDVAADMKSDVRMKIPLSVRRKEILEFFYPDVRLGGFGPLFSGVVLLSVAMLLLGARNLTETRTLYVVILLLALSVLVNPESWWARFAPQCWLIPILVVTFLRLDEHRSSLRVMAAAATGLLIVNVAVITVPYAYKQLKGSQKLLAQLEDLSRRKAPLKVSFFEFRSNRIRFREHDIKYVEVDHVPESDSIRVVGSATRIQSE